METPAIGKPWRPASYLARMSSARITTIDLLRGIVLVIMALDHVRDFFHYGLLFGADPTDMATTTPVLFFTRWITHDELVANPVLVKSKNVRPPVGSGRIRIVGIGEGGAIDTQPCGGTHVAGTAEVGDIHIGKIEKKGRENRRFRIRFGPAPLN